MISQTVVEILSKKMDEEQIRLNEPMKNHTSFQIGGPADVFILPHNIEQLTYAIETCKAQQIPYYIMGNGSNLLVSDKGYRGAIIQIYQNMSNVQVSNRTIQAEAGALLSTLSDKALECHLTGLEFASGIPGTLGGAVYMNAGAYDGEMKQIVTWAEVIDAEGNLCKLSNEELQLGYRSSIVQQKGWIVVRAEIGLQPGNHRDIKAKIDDLTERRQSKQPLEMPSAGSTFKRPEGYFAGKLIMDSGLRGYQIGGAKVSEKHCGFVVNTGNATAEDVLRLIEYIRDTIWSQYNVLMEPEVRMIGER